MTRPPTLEQLEPSANIALRDNRQVHRRDLGITIVPDTLVVEYEANGRAIPPTPTLERADGRTCYLFRLSTTGTTGGGR